MWIDVIGAFLRKIKRELYEIVWIVTSWYVSGWVFWGSNNWQISIIILTCFFLADDLGHSQITLIQNASIEVTFILVFCDTSFKLWNSPAQKIETYSTEVLCMLHLRYRFIITWNFVLQRYVWHYYNLGWYLWIIRVFIV